MSQLENNAFFWQKLDTLYFSSSIIITQPSGSAHPVYGNLIYPVNYGYLSDTLSQDETGISIYKGSLSANQVNTILIAADILKKDIEVKLLVGLFRRRGRRDSQIYQSDRFSENGLDQTGHGSTVLGLFRTINVRSRTFLIYASKN